MGFDPTQYKTTTRQQWEDAAEAGRRWGRQDQQRALARPVPDLDGFVGPCGLLVGSGAK